MTTKMINDNIELVSAERFYNQQDSLEDTKYDDDKGGISEGDPHLSVLPAGEEAEIKEWVLAVR
jgi:hypothetical protein